MAQALYSPSFFLKLAVGLSVGVHAIVLAVRFVPPALEELGRHRDLDVVLVNSKSDTRPVNATKLAQVDLDGGGNTDEDRSLTSPLPNVDNSTQNQQLEETQKRVVELERKQQQLMQQAQSDTRVNLADSLQAQTPELAYDVQGQEDMQRLREMQMLQAEIHKNMDAYQKRPKRSFVGARAKAVPEARYVEAFRRRIEKVGTENFPREASRRKLYGAVLLTIEIKSDGSLGVVQIRRSSGSRILDQAALSIVRLAAPFPRFPPELRKNADVLDISRHLIFTADNQLESLGSD